MGKTKVLVTGVSGLLGSHFIESVYEHFEIHALVRQFPEQKIPGVCYYIADLSKEWSCDMLPLQMDVVFHFAQSELFREFPSFSLEVFNVNVVSTVKLLDYAQKAHVKRFIFTSTGGIYSTKQEPHSENSIVNPSELLGNYFSTKMCSEIMCQSYKNIFDITILRLFFLYGKGQKRSMLIPRLVDNIRDGRSIKINKNGGILVNPVHVSDVVKLCQLLINFSGSHTLNVGGPEILSIRQISTIIGKELGVDPIYEFDESVGFNWIGDIQLLEKTIYQPVERFSNRISELL